jgi:Tat protein secretion system quality control protein TatD with DNase activity
MFLKEKAKRRQDDMVKALSSLTLEQILLETDAPYQLAPGIAVGHNHPWLIWWTAEHLARIMHLPRAVILETARINACRFYGLTA